MILTKPLFSKQSIWNLKRYCVENFIKAKEVPVKAFPDYKRQFTANGGFSQLLLLLPAKIMMVMVVRCLRWLWLSWGWSIWSEDVIAELVEFEKNNSMTFSNMYFVPKILTLMLCFATFLNKHLNFKIYLNWNTNIFDFFCYVKQWNNVWQSNP